MQQQPIDPSGIPESIKTPLETPDSAATSAEDRAAFLVNSPLEPVPSWARYDAELEHLCRVAASVGAADPEYLEDRRRPPLSYTALIIAFLWSDDRVSKWFRSYAEVHSIDLPTIFSSKGANDTHKSQHVAQARSGGLPPTRPLYSTSATRILRAAADIARVVQDDSASTVTVGACHVMAAYAFRNPVDHRDQVRGWRFDEKHWQGAFLTFANETFPEDHWSRIELNPPPRGERIVSSFTNDDPLAMADDLLDVDDEAAAFARIAAATSISPPLAIGVFGEWGSGKTFFMRRIYENVHDLTHATESEGKPALFYKDIVQIRFNAWHYIETNLWASLVEYIFTELDRWLAERGTDGQAQPDLVFDRLATAQQLKLDALEDVAARRSERRTAEQRAERARKEYEQAAARSAAVGAGTYARAFLSTVLKQESFKKDLKTLGEQLGAPELSRDAGKLVDVLDQARTEAGRARLMVRAGMSQIGHGPWLLGVVGALVLVPLTVVGLSDLVAWGFDSTLIASVHKFVLAVSSVLGVIAYLGRALVQHASSTLSKIDEFDNNLREQIAKQVEGTNPADAVIAEDELRKRKQELEAAERALADADARLVAARQDFENASSRSRLNAFIRAKATQGDYAKYLGIIAAIRRDFGQLATLMSAANRTAEQEQERERLVTETATRIRRFLDWLKQTPDVTLTAGEVRGLFMLLEPTHKLWSEDAGAHTMLLKSRFEENAEAFATIQEHVQATHSAEPPRFSRIILYIDDLDRCPPDTVAKVLQAVHLLLSFPLFTVVVAVDSRWVSRALRDQFPQMLSEPRGFAGNGGAPGTGATSHDYLEKIFQIPYWVRPIDRRNAERYVGSLVKKDVTQEIETTRDSNIGVRTESTEPPTATVIPPAGASETPTPITGPASTNISSLRHNALSSRRPHRTRREEVASLELSQWESDALQRFASLVGGTPRRLIRFVNVYRLIKASLPPKLLAEFVGGHGESASYRGLVAQLAIVTGAPEACQRYFAMLETLKKDDSLSRLTAELDKDEEFLQSTDFATVRDILSSAKHSTYGAELTVAQLRSTASIARRYSFIARPN